MPLNLVILFGSVRSDRQGIKAVKFVQRQLYLRRFNRFASELEWYAGALKVARHAGLPY